MIGGVFCLRLIPSFSSSRFLHFHYLVKGGKKKGWETYGRKRESGERERGEKWSGSLNASSEHEWWRRFVIGSQQVKRLLYSQAFHFHLFSMWNGTHAHSHMRRFKEGAILIWRKSAQIHQRCAKAPKSHLILCKETVKVQLWENCAWLPLIKKECMRYYIRHHHTFCARWHN